VSYSNTCVCAETIVRCATMCAFCDKSRELDAAGPNGRLSTPDLRILRTLHGFRWVRETTNMEPRWSPFMVKPTPYGRRLFPLKTCDLTVFLQTILSFLLFSHRWWITPLWLDTLHCNQLDNPSHRSANNDSLSLVDYKVRFRK